MKTENKLGIWMDRASAHITEFTADSIKSSTITSKFTHYKKQQTLEKSEDLMNHKEQHEQAAYYKDIAEKIRNYTDVLLFGPTHEKDELCNILKLDHRFANINLEVLPSDKMTVTEQQTFIKNHFTKQ